MQVIAEVDKNGDGVISPEEFRLMMGQIIKREVETRQADGNI